jgi:hypothetical protein
VLADVKKLSSVGLPQDHNAGSLPVVTDDSWLFPVSAISPAVLPKTEKMAIVRRLQPNPKSDRLQTVI